MGDSTVNGEDSAPVDAQQQIEPVLISPRTDEDRQIDVASLSPSSDAENIRNKQDAIRSSVSVSVGDHEMGSTSKSSTPLSTIADDEKEKSQPSKIDHDISDDDGVSPQVSPLEESSAEVKSGNFPQRPKIPSQGPLLSHLKSTGLSLTSQRRQTPENISFKGNEEAKHGAVPVGSISPILQYGNMPMGMSFDSRRGMAMKEEKRGQSLEARRDSGFARTSFTEILDPAILAARKKRAKKTRQSISHLRCAVFQCPNQRVGKAFCSEHQKIESLAPTTNPDEKLPTTPIERLKVLMKAYSMILAGKGHKSLSSCCERIEKGDEVSVLNELCEMKAAEAPLTSLALTWNLKDEKVKAEYQILEKSVSGKTGDLNRGTGGKNIYLCYKKTADDVPISCVSISFDGKSEEPPLGFKKIAQTIEGKPGNLNYGSLGKETYLSFRKGGRVAIIDVALIYPKDKESTPSGFHTLTKSPNGRLADLNIGSDNHELFLCFKVSPSNLLVGLRQVHEEAKVEKKLHVGALAIILSALYIPDDEIIEQTFNLLRKIEVNAAAPLPRQGLNYLLKALCELQPLLLSCADRKLQLMNALLIRDMFDVRMLDVQPDTAATIVRNCFFTRHEDKKENILFGIVNFATSLRKDFQLRKLAEETKSSKNEPDVHPSQSVVSGILSGLVEHVHICKTIDPTLQSIQRARGVSDEFIKDVSDLCRHLFKDPTDRIVAALLITISKFLRETSGLRVSSSESESVKRKLFALGSLELLFQSLRGFIISSPEAQIILRRCFFPCFVETFITFNPTIATSLLGLLALLFKKYSRFCKMELAITLDFLFEILVSRYCFPEQKIEIIEGIARLFRIPSSIVNLYYNFDNRYREWPIFEKYVRILSRIARGEMLNVLDQTDMDLQCAALTSMVNVLELITKYLVRKSGYVQGEARVADEEEVEEDERRQDLDEAERSSSKKAIKSANSVVTADVKSDETTQLKRRTSTWKRRFDDQKKLEDIFKKALEIARQKSLKKAILVLWKSKTVFVTVHDVAKWLKTCEGLDKSEVGDFLGADFTNDFSVEFFIDLRSAYLTLFDFSSMPFDQAFRMYLLNAGFRLPGEAQKIDRLLEAFADAYCRDNPSIFPSTESAFIISFSLIMLNTELNDPRIANGKRTRPPMTIEEFVSNLRRTDGGNLLSEELLRYLYNSVKETPIEWKDTATKTDLENDSISLEQRAHMIEKGFLQECDVFLSRALGQIRSETFFQRSYLGTSSTHIVDAIFEISWAHYLSGFTSLISKSRAVEVIAVSLDGLRYAICTSILLSLPKEIDAFSRILAKITFAESFSGTNEELQWAYVKGSHLDQEWFAALPQLAVENPKAACKKINFLANESRRKVLYERDQKLLKEIEIKLGGEIILVDAERRFIREGELIKVGRNNRTRSYRFFLFNNLLIYASPGTANHKKYKIHRTIHLAVCRIIDLKNQPNHPEIPLLNAFTIENPQKEVTVVCESPAVKQAWIVDLKKAIESTLERQRKLIENEEARFFEPSQSKTINLGMSHGNSESSESKRQSDQIMARVIVSSQDLSRCKLCIMPFGTFSKRKFTCPHCKQNVCSDCSLKQVDLQEITQSVSRQQRVCDTCHGILTGVVKFDVPIVTRDG